MSRGGIRRIDSYNALRGICALGILFSHMSYLAAASNPFWRLLYDHFMRFGSRCCSFFFIMSGFLLAYTWKDESFGQFIKEKLKKLYPLTIFVFILAVGCSFILNETVNGDMAIGSPIWLLSLALNLTLLKAFVPIKSVFYSFHGPSWYVSVLFGFYIIGYFITRKIKHSRDTHGTMILAGGGVLLAYLAQLAVCLVVDKYDLSDAKLYLTYVNPYFRIFGEGMLGILLCEVMPQIQERIQSLNRDMLGISALIVFIGFFIATNFVSSSIWGAWIWFVPVSLVLVAFYRDDGVVSSLFKGRFWQFLGSISLEVYMTHAFVYEGLPIAAGVVSGAMKDWIVYHAGTRFVITLIASIVFAWVVHVALNSRRWRKRVQ